MFKRLHVVQIILLLGIVSCNIINGTSIQHPKVDDIINKARNLSNLGKLESRDSLINESLIKLRANSDWNGFFDLCKWYLNEYELPDKAFVSTCALDYVREAKYSGIKEEEFYSCYLASKLFIEINTNNCIKIMKCFHKFNTNDMKLKTKLTFYITVSTFLIIDFCDKYFSYLRHIS